MFQPSTKIIKPILFVLIINYIFESRAITEDPAKDYHYIQENKAF